MVCSWMCADSADGGGIFRRANGTWHLGYSVKFKATTPLAAEFLAIREGLKIARQYNITKLELETDALALKPDDGTLDQLSHL